MKTICLYFEIHQIIHLKRYRFFDIGRDHYYYDDYENERSITDIAERSYVPALRTIIDMANQIVMKRGQFAAPDTSITMCSFVVSCIVEAFTNSTPLHGEVIVVIE